MNFRVVNASTVSDALAQGLHHLAIAGQKQPSRVGDVLVSHCPVMTVYENPLNRVLFSPLRDANPFFHVMESLWMLAGRNDLPWLTQFNKGFASYSDDGGLTQPGAYGYRWRNYFGYDQLETIITELKHNPTTRRCVLTMWDGGVVGDARETTAETYPLLRNGDLFQALAGSADVPCNTHAYFDMIDGKLNMTVCCRSNDIIWGAYGANAVHFSFLLEYVAAATGLPMGVYRQMSNNFHLYTNIVPAEQLMPWARNVEESDRYRVGSFAARSMADLRRVPLVGDEGHEKFLRSLLRWFEEPNDGDYAPFLQKVATPMHAAYMAFKAKNYDDAIHNAEMIRAEDWRIACIEWLQRRKVRAQQNTERFTEVVGHSETSEHGGEDNGTA